MAREILINEDDAKIELNSICEELGIDPEGKNYDSFLELVQYGDLFLDKERLVVYSLKKPVESQEGVIVLDKLKFREPTAGELQRALRGIKIDMAGGSSQVDASDTSRKTVNLASALTGVGIGIIEKMKARDFEVVQAITGFFG